MLILKILSFVHVLSLILNLVNQIEIQNGITKTWVTKYGLDHPSEI